MSWDAFGIQYGYFIATLFTGVAWLLFFILRPDLRREMVWMSVLFCFGGLTESYFVPQYWHPGSLFSLIDRIGVGIESVTFSFFVGGIAGVCYEVVSGKYLQKERRRSLLIRVIPISLGVGLFFLLTYSGVNSHLYNFIFPLLAVFLFYWFAAPELAHEAFWGAVIFGLLYSVLFLFFLALFPSYITSVYSVENLWGTSLLGIPLEEILFSISLGAALAPLYEYVNGYRAV